MRNLPSTRLALLILTALGLTACGAVQAVRDSTAHAAKRMFTSQVPVMNLDIVNSDTGESHPAVVRIYQLKSSERFQALTDAQWLTNDLATLKADLLATHNLVLPAGGSKSINSPMKEQTLYVGMVALMHENAAKPMKLLIPRKQWVKARTIDVEIDRSSVHLRARESQSERVE